MIEPDKSKAIFLLHQAGAGAREISRRFGISRNTVRDVIRRGGAPPEPARKNKLRIDPELLRRLYEQCDGYARRVHEKLVEEEKIRIAYPTLTRMLRDLGIGAAPRSRCDEVPDQPGVEMQHDTTVYKVNLADKPVRVVASLLYLRFSKRRYLKFSRVFTRFKMKCFFHEALSFWEYAAAECIIDNTNLARLRGTGADAVMVPEMEAFARQYGFRFRCHEKGHANRKAGDEKGLHTVETNFLPGRRFASLEDMNAQAIEWATERMFRKPLGKTRVIPAEAFECEKAHLIKLPPHLPAPYQSHERVTDQYGYISFAGNYYWVPGAKREDITVLQYEDTLKLHLGRECLAEYRLLADGVTNQKVSPEGLPRPRHNPHNRRKPTMEEEKRLRGMAEAVNNYLDFALKPQGIQRHRFVRELFALTRQMSPELFIKTIERGLRYRITGVDVLRRIAILYMTVCDKAMPSVDVDEGLLERPAYLEGNLTEAPDFSVYDKILEEDDAG